MISRGRGATVNPAGRFERLEVSVDEEFAEANPRTHYLRDSSQSVISRNDSPDISFGAGLNPYRGCEHGCSYCYARPYHEYLGFSAGLDFETRILVKPDAPEILRRELSSPKWKPEPLAMSGITDCYQPIEKKLRITRGCLEVLAEFRNPVGIVTKNHLVTRDVDVLGSLAGFDAVQVHISVTTLDSGLASVLEPRASQPGHRLEAIRKLAEAGIPVGVLVAPVIPGLNEHEIPEILKVAKAAGATRANYTILRLPHGVKDIFTAWLHTHRPETAEKVLGRIREVRGGALNDSDFGARMRGEGIYAEQIQNLFDAAIKRHGLEKRFPPLSTAAFRRPAGPQMELF
jgi:DNA repair photolyase